MGLRSKRAAVAAALVTAVAAGGGELRDAPSAGTAEAASSSIDLRIRIAASAKAAAPARTWRLRCRPGGGDWPSVAPACRRLKPALLATIEIETKDVTQITRQPVRITGRAFGKAVFLRFPAMGSGTRRARLKLLRTALGPRAFSEAERRSR
jgi:hypothetical protein